MAFSFVVFQLILAPAARGLGLGELRRRGRDAGSLGGRGDRPSPWLAD